ncbi:hypothetical protein C5167_034500 [Papaver somniferum]|uniref:Uncharacterized protein n=1 Tax=Papaver somniferum TaxID=3469 RepID=A0A4Y7KEQ1_PAPSO|nr:hypothetical protein C5167_034500 [Papaver somniferum]
MTRKKTIKIAGKQVTDIDYSNVTFGKVSSSICLMLRVLALFGGSGPMGVEH